MPRVTTAEFRTELNINGAGGTVAGRRYRAVRQFILQKCQERNILSRRQAGDTLWNQVRTEAVGHTTLQGFQAKFNTPQNGPYQAFHLALDSLIIDVLKKAAESRRNARMNSDNEQEEEAGGAGSGSGSGSRDVARPQLTVHEERPVRIIFIETSGANPGQARQLPWVMHGNATPNKSWLAILRHYTLQELGEAACRYIEDGEHPRQFIGILRDIQGMNVTPDAADQIELIDDDQVNAWLRLSRCTTLTVACFLHRAAVVPPGGGDPVRPNTPLVGHNRGYFDPGQFDVAEFYTEPDSDSDVQEDPGRQAKRRRTFPRSHAGWEKRIQSNDRKVTRFQNHSRELISRARVRQGAAYMSQYAGQDVQNVALPPGIPPPGCEAP